MDLENKYTKANAKLNQKKVEQCPDQSHAGNLFFPLKRKEEKDPINDLNNTNTD